MAGYIAITMTDWIDCVNSLNSSSAVFWCKKKTFKALLPGEKFYFLERGKFKSNADRYIVGSGEFTIFDSGSLNTMWGKYATKLGFREFDVFEEHIKSVYNDSSIEIGCIVLDRIRFFDQKISLDECNVEFSPCIVSGKRLTLDECTRIEKVAKEKSNGQEKAQ